MPSFFVALLIVIAMPAITKKITIMKRNKELIPKIKQRRLRVITVYNIYTIGRNKEKSNIEKL